MTKLRVLLSVSDKTGLVPFVQGLANLPDVDCEFVSTGGTATTLRSAGFTVTDVSEVTRFPEMMGGRLKTLHPLVHGGLLGRPQDEADMQLHGIEMFNLLVVNLYPFQETVASGASLDECIENIDIGGPAMLRAAAKNYGEVAVICNPADYDMVLCELHENGEVSLTMRWHLMGRVFAYTAQYDAAIAAWQTVQPVPTTT